MIFSSRLLYLTRVSDWVSLLQLSCFNSKPNRCIFFNVNNETKLYVFSVEFNQSINQLIYEFEWQLLGLFGVTETIQHFGPPLPNCCWLESPVGQVHLVVEDVHQGPFEEIATQPLKVSKFG